LAPVEAREIRVAHEDEELFVPLGLPLRERFLEVTLGEANHQRPPPGGVERQRMKKDVHRRACAEEKVEEPEGLAVPLVAARARAEAEARERKGEAPQVRAATEETSLEAGLPRPRGILEAGVERAQLEHVGPVVRRKGVPRRLCRAEDAQHIVE